jgi:hypothetical protein
MTIPLSLASMALVNQTSQSFTSTLFSLFGESESLAEQFKDVRKLYEFENVPNKVVDGTEPFPEDQQSIRSGISLEFRCLDHSLLHIDVSEIYLYQECIVPIPWCREVCSPRCFVQDHSWSALRMCLHICSTPFFLSLIAL